MNLAIDIMKIRMGKTLSMLQHSPIGKYSSRLDSEIKSTGNHITNIKDKVSDPIERRVAKDAINSFQNKLNYFMRAQK